jgi:hypothetical protein
VRQAGFALSHLRAMMRSNVDPSRYEWTYVDGKVTLAVRRDDPEQTLDQIKKALVGMPIVFDIRHQCPLRWRA